MEDHWLSRTELLISEDKLNKIRNKNILVAGLGGVGAYAAEHLCRCGVGKMTIVDGDVVSESNRNRQLIALKSTQGKSKAKLMEDRLRDINPDIDLTVINEYVKDERIIEILDEEFDFVVDAIDTLGPKIYLIYNSIQKGHKVYSSMGSGGKLNPEEIKITDISKSYNCTLARVLRKKLHRLGIRDGVKVVFSPEKHDKDSVLITENEPNKKSIVGTISYMPAIFGCFLASAIINDIINED